MVASNNTEFPGGQSQISRLAFLLRDSALYGGAAALSKAFGLVTFPLLSRHFTVSDYGVLDYYLVLSALMATFVIFGQDSAVARYYYEYKDNYSRRQIISQSLVQQSIVALVLIPIMWVFSVEITSKIVSTTDSTVYFKIVLIQLPFVILINHARNVLKWTFARVRFLLLSLGYAVVQTLLLLGVVWLLPADIAVVLWVGCATSILFAIMGLIFIKEWLVYPDSLGILKEMLLFAAPYGAIGVMGAIMPALDRSLTNNILGAEAMGLYGAATKIAMFVMLFIGAFQTAWGPFYLSLHGQTNAIYTYNVVLKVFATSICLVALSMSLVAQPLIEVLASERYSGAAVVVFPLVMGLAVQATSWITEIGIDLSKKSYMSLIAYVIAFLSTLAGIWMFTPIYGLFGVGIGVLIGYYARAISASWLAQRAFPLSWQYRPVAMVIVLTTICGFSASWLRTVYGNGSANLMLVSSILLIITLSWFFVLSRKERQRVLALVKSART